MHPAFLAKLHPKPLFDFGGNSDVTAPPGPLPTTTRLPKIPEAETAQAALAEQDSAVGRSNAQDSETTLQKMGKWLSFGSDSAPSTTSSTAPPSKPKPTQTAAAKPAHPATAPAANKPAKPASEVAQAAPGPAAPASAPSPFDGAPKPNPVMAGAAPVVQSGSFAGRWDALR
jgi:hypothetical protein